MITLPASRLTFIGLLLLLPGTYLAIRFASGFVRVLSRKFRRGKPYLKGSATDYSLYAAGSLAVAILGGCLTLASALQGGLQPLSALREVGKVKAEAPGEGRLRLTLTLEEDYPGRRELQMNLPGARWALEGEFLRWKVKPAWLGIRDGHRIEAALGTRAPSGSQNRPANARSLVSGTYPLWYLASRHPRWVPVLETSRRLTPWMPADGTTYRLFAGPAGYVLVEERKEEAGRGPGV